MPSVSEVITANLHLFGSVPTVRPNEVCTICRGPVDGWRRCYACKELDDAVPFPLAGHVVPMTVALKPSAWYSRLYTYKGTEPHHRSVLGALSYAFIRSHRARIAQILGGAPDAVTVVPSKKRVPTAAQPLWGVLSSVNPPLAGAGMLLRHVQGCQGGRQQYRPDCFVCVENVAGRRIILLEDTWVTGATAVSAAGALYAAGAEAVIVLPIARMVRTSTRFQPADLPYFTWVKEPYDLARWPE